jgi:hypothetical protein
MKSQTIITTFFVLCLLLFVGFSHAGTWVENFNDEDYKDWKLIIGSWSHRAEVKVVNGELVFKHFNISSPFTCCPDKLALEASRNWSDYTIELRFKFAEGTGSGIQCMFVTYHDTFQNELEGGPNGPYVAALLSGDVLGEVAINGVRSIIKKGWYQFSQGTWYRMKILVEGTHYEIFIDGQQVVAYDSEFTKGGIGVGAWNLVTNFDDIRIYGDSVLDGDAAVVRTHGKLTTTWAEMKK